MSDLSIYLIISNPYLIISNPCICRFTSKVAENVGKLQTAVGLLATSIQGQNQVTAQEAVAKFNQTAERNLARMGASLRSAGNAAYGLLKPLVERLSGSSSRED